MNLRCQAGDLAIVIHTDSDLDDNLGLLVNVIEPAPELHTACRFAWKVVVVSGRGVKAIHSEAGHMTRTDAPDSTYAAAYDDDLRPIRPGAIEDVEVREIELTN